MAKSSSDSDNDEDNENTENWEDERDSMTAEQLTVLNRSVQLVRLMLVKVHIESKLYIIDHNSPYTSQLCKTAFAIKNSSTIILPCWYEIFKELELGACMMPWDVLTRWNSTFNMLMFAIDYCLAINTIIAECSIKLHDYELRKEKWKLAKELYEVLKVCY
jgi:hypothetical protein